MTAETAVVALAFVAAYAIFAWLAIHVHRRLARDLELERSEKRRILAILTRKLRPRLDEAEQERTLSEHDRATRVRERPP